MKLKKPILLSSIAICIFIIGGIIIERVSSQKKDLATVASPSGLKPRPDHLVDRQIATMAAESVPDDIVYGHVFRHIEEINRRADEEERKGKDGKHLRNLYKQMAQLDDGRTNTLDRIAKDTNIELKRLDSRAKQIIATIRARTPNRKLEHGQLPVIPQELRDLSMARKNLILRSITDLRQAFGEAEFLRFVVFVDQNVKPGIRQRRGN